MDKADVEIIDGELQLFTDVQVFLSVQLASESVEQDWKPEV